MDDFQKPESEPLQFGLFNGPDEEHDIVVELFEIIRHLESDATLSAHNYMNYLVNVGGLIVPVMDFRTWFGMDVMSHGEMKPIITIGHTRMMVGYAFAGRSEVLMSTLGTAEVPLPGMEGSSLECIRGVAKLGDRLFVLLDLDKLLSWDDRGFWATAEV